VFIKHESLYLDAASLRVHSCEITVQQIWRLLGLTSPSPRERRDLISKQVNNLGTSTNIRPWIQTGPWNQKGLCWRGPAEIPLIGMDWILHKSLFCKCKYVTRWRSWLRHHATSREVAGFIGDEVTGFFNWCHLVSRSMALGSTQPLTEMSTSNLPDSKCASVA
jgi:hypothetical protein